MPRRLLCPPLLASLFALLIVGASSTAGNAQGLVDGGFDPKQLEEMTANARQVLLTKEAIEKLIASSQEMRETGAKFPGTELPDTPAPGGTASELDAMPADKRAALEDVAKKHGFKDLAEWSDVANTVVMSYVYAAQGKKPGSVEEAVRLNIAQAERDPNLTEAQRTEVLALYRRIGDVLRRLEPDKGNYALVMEMKDELAPIMDPE